MVYLMRVGIEAEKVVAHYQDYDEPCSAKETNNNTGAGNIAIRLKIPLRVVCRTVIPREFGGHCSSESTAKIVAQFICSDKLR